MDEKIKRIYVPMTETGFYILFSLQEECHGYHVIQYVKRLTNNEVVISAGTLYGSLSKMEKDQLIAFTREEEKRKYYRITELGREVLKLELQRINRLFINSKGVYYYGNEKGI